MEASQNPMNHVSKSTKSIYVLIRRTPLMSNALTARRSIRKFQPTPVSPDTIRAIVAVAAYAPSWKNSQTTRYTLLTKREEIDRVADECTMGLQKNIDTLHGAPALVVLTTVNDRSGYERDGSFSTSKGTHWQSFDAGLAAEAFCVAAHDAGLGTVILGIYDEGKVKAVLNLPETESVSALIPIGVPAESPAAPKRKDVSELLRIR
jgi:NADPH-flavin oxidoreductase